MKRSALFLLGVALITCFDVASKMYILSFLELGEEWVLGRYISLVLVYNKGIAFGLFAAMSQMAFFILIILTSFLIGVFMVWGLRSSSRVVQLSCCCISGGAVGNFTDRILRGAVLDFIDVHIGVYHFPAFNIGDSFITLGCMIFVGCTAWKSVVKY